MRPTSEDVLDHAASSLDGGLRTDDDELPHGGVRLDDLGVGVDLDGVDT